ncbi:MAG: WecB/TagA/CpsF family glycosyltransferase [Pseudomonadota bacterium]
MSIAPALQPSPEPGRAPAARAPVARVGGGQGAVSITERDRKGLMGDLAERLRRAEGFAVATLNLDHCVKLRRDPGFRAAYVGHTHVTADGRPIVWLAALAGTPVSLVTGSDNTTVFAGLAAQTEVPLALIGGTAEGLAAAEEALRMAHPGLTIALSRAPRMGFDPEGAEADGLIQAIAESDARLVLLALGAPRQERFAARALAQLPGVGFVSIGAGLDFVTGRQQRAPLWLRRLALEWLWRLSTDPRRMARRYLDCVLVLPVLAMAAVAQRRHRP